jgi:hypothetical protein
VTEASEVLVASIFSVIQKTFTFLEFPEYFGSHLAAINTESYSIGLQSPEYVWLLAGPVPDISPIGMRSEGRPKNRWDEVLNDLKKLQVRNWTYLVIDRKHGMNWFRRPKPTEGCSVSRKRRRFRHF